MDRFLISNAFLNLEILPSIGGKISSLFDRTRREEWLWTNPWLLLREPFYGESYVRCLDFGGWDEIFPSVDPCRIAIPGGEGEVPDHGDLVQMPWRVVANGVDHLEMEVKGRSLPFIFRRRLELIGQRVRCLYSLENRASFSFPWLWCAHPLVPLDECLGLQAGGPFRVLYASGAAADLQGRKVDWNQLPPRSERWAAKLFSDEGGVGAARLRKGNGSTMTLEWNPAEIPFLGLWVNNGGWSGCGSEPYFNLGIEPATLPIDNISSVKNPPRLQPGEIRRWSLEIHLSSDTP